MFITNCEKLIINGMNKFCFRIHRHMVKTKDDGELRSGLDQPRDNNDGGYIFLFSRG